jgi:hypothetical protein
MQTEKHKSEKRFNTAESVTVRIVGNAMIARITPQVRLSYHQDYNSASGTLKCYNKKDGAPYAIRKMDTVYAKDFVKVVHEMVDLFKKPAV